MQQSSEKQLTPDGKAVLTRFLDKVGFSDETLRKIGIRAERYLMTEQFKGKYWIEKEKTTVEAVAQGKYLQK
jgi:hypothetical protein